MTCAEATCEAIATCSCQRCRGLLVWEPESWNIRRRWKLGSYRCVQCGEFIDLDVLRNRQYAPVPHQTNGFTGRCWPNALAG